MVGIGIIEIAALVGMIAVVVVGVVVAVAVNYHLLYKSAQTSQQKTLTNAKLMACPDCEQPVSKLAVTCPHCGRPLKYD